MEPAAVLRILLSAQGARDVQIQLAKVNAEAKRTADSTDRMGKSFDRANNKTASFNKEMMGLRNVISIMKWPAMIAGAGQAAGALGALGTAAGAVTAAMGPLTGAGAGVAGLYTAMGQAAGVAKLAFTDIGKAMSGNKQALDKLTPAQRQFVQELKGAQTQLKSLRQTAAAGMLPGVAQALRIVMPLMDRLRPIVAATAHELGSLAIAAARMVQSMGPAFSRIGKTNVTVIDNLGRAAISLGHALITIIDAARPLTLWMSGLIKQGAGWIDMQVQAAAVTGRLTGFLEKTRDVMTTLGHIIANLAVGLFNIGKAAAPLGRDLLGMFEKLTAQFRAWTESATGQNAIAKYFRDARGPAIQVFGLLGDIAKALAPVFRPTGATTGVIADLRKLVGVLGSVLQTTTRTLGPALMGTLTNLARVLGSVAGASGPLTLLFKIIEKVTGVIADLVQNNPGLSTAASFMLGLGSTWKVMSLLFGPLGRVAGGVKMLVGLTGGMAAFSGTFAGLKGAVTQGLSGASGQISMFATQTETRLGGIAAKARPALIAGMKGLGIAAGGVLVAQLAGSLVSGGAGSWIKSLGSGAAIGAGIGKVFGVPFAGAVVGALAGGLMKLTSSPDYRAQGEASGRTFGRAFLVGVRETRGRRGAPAINPLPLPQQAWFNDQAAKAYGMLNTALKNRVSYADFARYGLPKVLWSPEAQAETRRATQLMATAVVTNFKQRISQARFLTRPAFLGDVMLYMQKTPPFARGAAARMMVQYAAGLEENRKLPVGSTTALIVALESRWHGLVPFLGNISGQSAQAVAQHFSMPEAKRRMNQTLANLRGQWVLWSKWNYGTNLPAIRQNFQTTWDHLKWVIGHGTRAAREEATKELNQLRHSHDAILLGMRNITGNRMSDIANIIGDKTRQAANRGGANIESFQRQVAHQEASAKTATSGHLNAIADIIGNKTQQAATQGGAHMRSFQQQTVHWEQVTHSSTSGHLNAIASIVGSKTQQAASQAGAHMRSFEQQVVHWEQVTHSSTSSHLNAIASIVGSKTQQAATQGGAHMKSFQQQSSHSETVAHSDTQRHLTAMGGIVQNKTVYIQRTANSNMTRFSGTVRNNMQHAVNATGSGANLILSATQKMLKSFGVGGALTSLGNIVVGKVGYAKGGIHDGYARGGMVNQPGYFAGEEAPRHKEVIIATNPAYRQKNLGFWAKAGEMLGVPGFAQGGVPPPAMRSMISRANWIDAQHFPYVYAGGHGSGFGPTTGSPGSGYTGHTIGYDCSGAVSAVLGAGGYIPRPSTWTGGLDRLGAPGPGQVTLYGNSSHIYMSILGRFFGTSGANPGGGAGWYPGSAEAGFGERHLGRPGHFAAGALPMLNAPKVKGGGTYGEIVQAALKKMTDAANQYIEKKWMLSGGMTHGDIGAISASTGNVLRDVFKTLTARGWNKLAIAGALGNSYQESGWNPASMEAGTDNGGLWGFTAHPVALSDVRAAAARAHVPWTNASLQAAFMAAHFGDLGRLNAAGSPSEAAVLFEQIFEHAGNKQMGNRIAAAQRAYSMGYARGGIADIDQLLAQQPPYTPTHAGSFRYGGMIDKRLNQLPPYGGSFASGGIVPGPEGQPRTIVAHGGEPVGQQGPLLVIENMNVDESFDELALAHKLSFLMEL